MPRATTDPATLRTYDAGTLIGLLDDRLGAVRREAVHALGAIRDPGEDVVAALQAALSDPYPPVAMYAAQALGRLRHRESIGLLSALVRSPDHALRVYVAEALAAMGHRAAYDALIIAAEDKVRRVAVAALSGLGAIVRPEDDEALAALQRRVPWGRRWRVQRLRRGLARRRPSQTS